MLIWAIITLKRLLKGLFILMLRLVYHGIFECELKLLVIRCFIKFGSRQYFFFWLFVFELFIIRSILPKLSNGLKNEFTVNPQNQKLEPVQWVLRWHPLIAHRFLAKVLQNEFFPKWFQALYTWLTRSNVDMDEIARWYMGWKQLLAPLKEQHDIKNMFNKALDLMNLAVNKQPLEPLLQSILMALHPPAKRPMAGGQLPSILSSLKEEANKLAMAKATTIKAEQEAAADEEDATAVEFIDDMEMFAAEQNILFMPNVKRGKHDGKQIYLFGNVNVYFDHQCIFYHDKNTPENEWMPIALDDLVKVAQ